MCCYLSPFFYSLSWTQKNLKRVFLLRFQIEIYFFESILRSETTVCALSSDYDLLLWNTLTQVLSSHVKNTVIFHGARAVSYIVSIILITAQYMRWFTNPVENLT